MRRIPIAGVDILALVVALVASLASAMPATPATSMAVQGASPWLEAQVEQALGDFTDHGLTAPVVTELTFDSTHPWCVDHGGRFDGESQEVLVCYDPETLTFGDGAMLHDRERRLLLHELAHAWTETNTSPQQRAAFVDLMGCDSWNDPDDRWHRRGTEMAAETFVWVLTEHQVQPRSIASREYAELEEGYALLTGG